MAHEYLFKEYELCFQQFRIYDDRQESLLKYLCTLTSATAVAEFAIYQFFKGPTVEFFRAEAFLSALVFAATLLIFVAGLQNRLYFVFMARQLNGIRKYLMEMAAEGFHDNQLYTSTTFPALKPFSTHTLMIIASALMSSMFAGASVYGITSALPRALGFAIGTTSVVLAAEVSCGMAYLMIQGDKRADHAIHHRKQYPNTTADPKPKTESSTD